MRVGVVGCGRIAEAHLESLATLPGATLAAVVEPDEARRAAAARWTPHRFEDYRDRALDGRLDAVLVCTPPDRHAEVCAHFLARGVHVLCEKPFTLRAAEARALLETARARRVRIAMASKFRYVDAVAKARALLDRGALGRLVLYAGAFAARAPMAGRWNATREISGGGALMDHGPHAVDLARFLVGPLEAVLAVRGPDLQGLPVEDTARLLFRARGGTGGVVDLSWSVELHQEHFARVVGSEGVLELGWRASRWRPAGEAAWRPLGEGYDRAAAFRALLEDFLAAAAGRVEARAGPEDALASVTTLEAAYGSMERSAMTPVGA